MTSTKSYKNIPCIPPLSTNQNQFVTDFKEKAEIFNSFFPEQCSMINNSSKLSSRFLKRKEKVISSISFSNNDIAKIIRDLDHIKLMVMI